MNKLINVLAFSIGAAVGSAITWKVLKDKYAKYADEEIASVKEEFSKRYAKADTKEVKEEPKEDDTVAVKPAYDSLAKQYQSNATKKKEVPDKHEYIYVIPPESFGEAGYETVSLTYYMDGVLAYDNTDEVVDDVEDLIGAGALNTFGEYEDDSVFVRNEELETDYEILRDLRTYSDVTGQKPHSVNTN